MINKSIACVKNSAEAMQNLRNLRQLRKNAGYSILTFSKALKMGKRSLYGYENMLHTPTVKVYNRLAAFFGWNLLIDPCEEERKKREARKTEREAQKLARLKNKVTFNRRFDVGHIYSIRSNQRYYQPYVWNCWDGSFLFRYEGQHGIHHYFREINNGWLRTQTNAQLIGKVIKEISGETV